MRVALLQLCARELRRGRKADRLSDALAAEERGGAWGGGGGGVMAAGKEGQSQTNDGQGTFSHTHTQNGGSRSNTRAFIGQQLPSGVPAAGLRAGRGFVLLPQTSSPGSEASSSSVEGAEGE